MLSPGGRTALFIRNQCSWPMRPFRPTTCSSEAVNMWATLSNMKTSSIMGLLHSFQPREDLALALEALVPSWNVGEHINDASSNLHNVPDMILTRGNQEYRQTTSRNPQPSRSH